ncbi:glycosyl hydrolase family 43 [Colletotrichum nymphaeae SA-01]|uniref:Glycosyl hydrolase family 43 n=1 Tax=Colletotrichum nymphaeae SA-01 TaxID=1460502 RepID=A0A135T531_9PEZI|nr:glycosyl hydrolase family 43 [Colletotrichum nymphaeae SA-01]
MLVYFIFLYFLVWAAAQTNFTNPIIWQDLPDIDQIRHGDAYYYSASTFHFSPGAVILRSYDLVNWEYLSHSVPSLDFGNTEGFDLVSGPGQRYNQGIFASYFNYRKSTDTFYWGGCIVGDWKTYVYTAPAVEGPWTQSSVIDTCLYDAGMLIDDDDTMYVAHGNTNISVAQLSDDGLRVVRDEVVFNSTEELGYIEGSRFYKRNGAWYLWIVKPVPNQIVLKSTTGPFGPYEWKWVLQSNGNPVPGAGNPHQGALVSTPNDKWHYIAHLEAYPGGRVPVLAPVHWDDEGWPHVDFVDGQWASSYPYPLPEHPVKPITGTDEFETLGPQYQWNHNPDNSAWAINNGLELHTATVTDDFFRARNTLTHRILGPQSTLTVELDHSQMIDGDRAGVVLFRYAAAWIGVVKSENSTRVAMVNNILMIPDDGWYTVNKGDEIASVEVSGATVWLRLEVGVNSLYNQEGRFSYSTDGVNFEPLGEPHEEIDRGILHFMGYQYGVFNYATLARGGAVTVKSLSIYE